MRFIMQGDRAEQRGRPDALLQGGRRRDQVRRPRAGVLRAAQRGHPRRDAARQLPGGCKKWWVGMQIGSLSVVPSPALIDCSGCKMETGPRAGLLRRCWTSI